VLLGCKEVLRAKNPNSFTSYWVLMGVGTLGEEIQCPGEEARSLQAAALMGGEGGQASWSGISPLEDLFCYIRCKAVEHPAPWEISFGENRPCRQKGIIR
jgi:hypothetical protein